MSTPIISDVSCKRQRLTDDNILNVIIVQSIFSLVLGCSPVVLEITSQCTICGRKTLERLTGCYLNYRYLSVEKKNPVTDRLSYRRRTAQTAGRIGLKFGVRVFFYDVDVRREEIFEK